MCAMGEYGLGFVAFAVVFYISDFKWEQMSVVIHSTFQTRLILSSEIRVSEDPNWITLHAS